MSQSKKSSLFLIVLLAISIIAPAIPIVKADPGWLEGWGKRVKITIDHNDIDETLSDFPVLIYLSDSSGINNEDLTFIFDEVGANSLKIAVTEDDGTTECYVEVEKWDLGNEKAWLWSKINPISNTLDTEIYLYYDNDHLDNTDHVGLCADGSASTEAVWSNGFVAVYHMKDETTNTILDSTSSDLDGTKKGANQPEELIGQIGPAQEFDPDEDIQLDAFGGPYTTMTLESWFQADDTDDARSIIVLSEVGGAIDRAYQIIVADTLLNYWRTDGVTVSPSIAWVDETNWHYFATTRSGTAIKGYPDGTLDAGLNGVVGDGTITSLTTCHIGSLVDVQNHFDGTIDEVRVSNVARNAAWIKATYETGIDDLLDFGNEEVLIFPPSDPNLLFGVGFNASSPYVELHWNHSIVDVQFFEVQNSSDGESWTYLGQSTTANYTDSQVVNGTERYYRVRACNQTLGTWYNSSWTDVNFEKAYFILGVGEFVCVPEFFNASSIEVIAGTLNDGNLASTFFVDGDWYNVSEVTGPPGIDIRVNFTDVGVGCGCFEFFQTFTGHPHHDIEVQIWNFTSTSWTTIGPIFFNETANWACIGLGHYYTHFFDDGNLYARFYHEGVGHVGHEFHVDRIDLSVIQAEECPGVVEVLVDYSIIFLAIGLIMCLAIYFLYSRLK